MLKNYHLAVIFVCFSVTLLVLLNIQSENIIKVQQMQTEYNKKIDKAVDDAVDSIVEQENGTSIFINREVCLTSFFESLYAGFGILHDKEQQERLKHYIPVLLVTDMDGYYLYRTELILDEDGHQKEISHWTEKKPYTYAKGNYIYNFTLTDYMKIYDIKSGELLEGKRKELSYYFKENRILEEDAYFNRIRRNCIIQSISKDMEIAVNQHNRIASNYGITYNFQLPEIDKDTWYQTVDDISLLVVFQGYPYGTVKGYYNRYAFGGAKIYKLDYYYITKENGVLYYHKENCSKVSSHAFAFPYDSRKECAKTGARPCEDCMP